MERGFHQAGCGAGTVEVATEILCRSDPVQPFYESPAAPTGSGIAFPRRDLALFSQRSAVARGKRQFFGVGDGDTRAGAVYAWESRLGRRDPKGISRWCAASKL